VVHRLLKGGLVPVNKTGISTKKKNTRNHKIHPNENRVQYNFTAISRVPAVFLSSGPFLVCLA